MRSKRYARIERRGDETVIRSETDQTPAIRLNKDCRRARRAILSLALGATVTSLLAPSANAVSGSWTGLGGNSSWNNNGNWSANFPGAGTTATFNATIANGNGTTTPIDVTGSSVNTIIFDTAAASPYVIGTTAGATLTLTNSSPAITMNSGVTANETVNAPLSVATGAQFTLTNNATSSNANLLIGGAISSASAISTLLYLSGSNVGANTISGNISNGTGGGTVNLRGNGTGDWIISGTNTYTGGTYIASGTVEFAKETALYDGATGSYTPQLITVENGATLALNVGGSGEFTSADVSALLANTVGISGDTGFRSTGLLGLDTTNATGENFSYANAITNSGSHSIGLTKMGANSLTLSGTNTYAGPTTISKGSLVVNGSLVSNSAVSVAAGATLAGSGTAAGSITVAAGGIVAPGAPSTANTTLTTGALTLDNTTGSTVSINVNTTGTPTTDLLKSNGAINLGAFSTLSVTDLGSSTLTAPVVLTIITGSGGLNGSFAGLAQGAVVPTGNSNNVFTIDYSHAGSVQLDGIAMTPEPASLGLLAFAGICLVRRSRRAIERSR